MKIEVISLLNSYQEKLYFVKIGYKGNEFTYDSSIAKLLNISLAEYHVILKDYGGYCRYDDEQIYFYNRNAIERMVSGYLENRLVMAALVENL